MGRCRDPRRAAPRVAVGRRFRRPRGVAARRSGAASSGRGGASARRGTTAPPCGEEVAAAGVGRPGDGRRAARSGSPRKAAAAFPSRAAIPARKAASYSRRVPTAAARVGVAVTHYFLRRRRSAFQPVPHRPYRRSRTAPAQQHAAGAAARL